MMTPIMLSPHVIALHYAYDYTHMTGGAGAMGGYYVSMHVPLHRSGKWGC